MIKPPYSNTNLCHSHVAFLVAPVPTVFSAILSPRSDSCRLQYPSYTSPWTDGDGGGSQIAAAPGDRPGDVPARYQQYR